MEAAEHEASLLGQQLAEARQALAEGELEARAERARDSERQAMQREEVEGRMLKMASVRGGVKRGGEGRWRGEGARAMTTCSSKGASCR